MNVNYSEIYSGKTGTSSTSQSDSSNSGLTVNSDTPQGQISKDEILQGKYASSTGANETNNQVKDSSVSNGDEEYIKTIKGNSGVSATSQKMIEQYRNIIRAVNSEIIYQLEPLFMGLY